MSKLLLASAFLFFLAVSACDMTPPDAAYDDAPASGKLTLAIVQENVANGIIKPCGLWIAGTDAAVEARHTASPTKPDIYQTLQPGGLSCSALIEAIPSFEASWGNGHAVVYYIQ